jgi:hypothetical protein
MMTKSQREAEGRMASPSVQTEWGGLQPTYMGTSVLKYTFIQNVDTLLGQS